MSFHVGQKVVCVDDGGKWQRFSWEELPVEGGVYHVRWTDGRTLRVAEIVNQPFPYEGGISELRFLASRFRPLVEDRKSVSFQIGADPDSECWDNRKKRKEKV